MGRTLTRFALEVLRPAIRYSSGARRNEATAWPGMRKASGGVVRKSV